MNRIRDQIRSCSKISKIYAAITTIVFTVATFCVLIFINYITQLELQVSLYTLGAYLGSSLAWMVSYSIKDKKG